MPFAPRQLQQASSWRCRFGSRQTAVGEPFHQSPAVVLPGRSAPSPPHW
ncbi:MAG: hypothetical protein ACHBN1_37545 [Heteroscytonema crispum UTEX LB 1556]